MRTLEEELVDLEKVTPEGGVRLASNTCDLRDLTIGESKERVAAYLEKFIDKTDQMNVFYLNHGNSKDIKNREIKQKLRLWLQTYPLIRRAKGAKKEDGGDDYTIVEVDT